MANNARRVDKKYIVIRHPQAQGAIVAKLGNRPLIPDSVLNYPDFVIQSVDESSQLSDATVDWSGLTDDEKELLIPVYIPPGFE